MADEETYSSLPLLDAQGNPALALDGKTPLIMHQTSGTPQTASAFGKAMSAMYNSKDKRVPEGYAVLPEGSMGDVVRSGFNTVAMPVREAARDVGGTTLSALSYLPSKLGEATGITPAGTTAKQTAEAERFGRGAADVLTTPISTPEQTLGTAATIAVTPLTAPGAYARNALLGGLSYGAGTTTGRYLTGQSFDPGKTALDLGLGALSGGVSTAIGQFANTYMTRNRADAVAKDVLDIVYKGAPALENEVSERAIGIALSNPQKLQAVTQKLRDGLMGSLDDATQQMITDINGLAPRSLSVGQQATLRAHGRAITKAGNEVLDNVNDPKAFAAAQSKLTAARQELETYVIDQFKGVKNSPQIQARAGQLLANHDNELAKVQNAAEVLDYMRQAGAEGQWNPAQYAKLIQDRYLGTSNPLLRESGFAVSGNVPIDEALTSQQGLVGRGMDLLSSLPGLPAPVRSAIRTAKPEPTPQLNWQSLSTLERAPATLPTQLAIQESGPTAINSFFSEASRKEKK